MPSDAWPELVKNTVLPIAPNGLTEVFNSCGCNFGAVENAVKTATIWYFKQRNGEKYSTEQLDSAFVGKEPGTPNFSVVSLTGGFHSNFNSFTSTKLAYLPKLNFLTADFPKLQYPFDNSSEESKALENTRKLFKSNSNISALIIEPIQQKGNYYASKKYYIELSKIVKEAGAALIVDETFTGLGSSGKLWAFEHFDIEPDILVFGGKTQQAGYFMKPEFRTPQPYQIMNTWCGDPARIELLKGIRSVIESQNLIGRAKFIGDYLLSNLSQIFVSKPQISNLRGIGLHIAFDFTSKENAWNFSRDLLSKGIHVNVVNDKVIQIHPALVFDKPHADVFLEAVQNSLN